jgi:hypothetical protein
MKESHLRSGLDCDLGFQHDEAMRPPAALACLAALIGLAVPAHADPDPDASFLDALNNAESPTATGLTPSPSAGGYAS